MCLLFERSMINTRMLSKSRFIFGLAACFLLSSCQLINTALRLAPLLLMAENDAAAKHSQAQVVRGSEVQARGTKGSLPVRQDAQRALAFKP